MPGQGLSPDMRISVIVRSVLYQAEFGECADVDIFVMTGPRLDRIGSGQWVNGRLHATCIPPEAAVALGEAIAEAIVAGPPGREVHPERISELVLRRGELDEVACRGLNVSAVMCANVEPELKTKMLALFALVEDGASTRLDEQLAAADLVLYTGGAPSEALSGFLLLRRRELDVNGSVQATLQLSTAAGAADGASTGRQVLYEAASRLAGRLEMKWLWGTDLSGYVESRAVLGDVGPSTDGCYSADALAILNAIRRFDFADGHRDPASVPQSRPRRCYSALERARLAKCYDDLGLDFLDRSSVLDAADTTFIYVGRPQT